MLTRRGIIGGLGALLAAPAVVKTASLMPVRGIIMPVGAPPTLGQWLDMMEHKINPPIVYYNLDLDTAIFNRMQGLIQFRGTFAAHLAEDSELYGAAPSNR